MNKYGKAIAAVIGAILTAVYAATSGDNRIEPDEWLAVAIAATTAIGVYLIPLDARFRWGKTAVGVLLAVLQAATTLILGGLDSNEWILLVLAGLTALGVIAAPAISDNGVAASVRNDARAGVSDF
jgi:peptidoglycan/LPS O-acetylase OafA/YrhL